MSDICKAIATFYQSWEKILGYMPEKILIGKKGEMKWSNNISAFPLEPTQRKGQMYNVVSFIPFHSSFPISFHSVILLLLVEVNNMWCSKIINKTSGGHFYVFILLSAKFSRQNDRMMESRGELNIVKRNHMSARVQIKQNASFHVKNDWFLKFKF